MPSRLHTHMLCVDNRSRDSGQADNSFVLTTQRLLNVVAVRVESAEVPNRLFDVDATNNDFDIQVNAGPIRNLSVAAGSYNGTTLAAALQAAIEAVDPGTMTVSFDAKTNYITFNRVGGNTFSLLVGTGANIATGIWETLGFSDATDRTTVTTATGDITVQLRADEHYVYLRLDGLGSVETSDSHSDIMAKLSTDDVSKFSRVYSVAKTYGEDSPLPSLSRLRISLVRRDGSLYRLRSSPFSFTLAIDYMG